MGDLKMATATRATSSGQIWGGRGGCGSWGWRGQQWQEISGVAWAGESRALKGHFACVPVSLLQRSKDHDAAAKATAESVSVKMDILSLGHERTGLTIQLPALDGVLSAPTKKARSLSVILDASLEMIVQMGATV